MNEFFEKKESIVNFQFSVFHCQQFSYHKAAASHK